MKTFQPDCTLPPPEPTFVAGPNIRSTLDIVWSCLSVILLSTWSVIRLTVPPQVHPHTRSQRLGKTLWLVLRKVKWMLWALLAPEILLGDALAKYASARQAVKKMRDLAKADDVEWTLTHAFFADMGGFVVKFLDEPSDGTPAVVPEPVAEFQERMADDFRNIGLVEWTPHRVHCDMAAEIGFDTGGDGNPHLVCLAGNIWVLNATQLTMAREYGIISRLPALSEDEINDKSKSDGLVKLLAVTQLAWLVLQLIVRAVRDKPSTQLEIMALSYAICAAVTYGLVWSRPKDVSQPVVLEADRFPTKSQMCLLGLECPSGLRSEVRAHYALDNRNDKEDTLPLVLGILVGAIVFGLIHIAAWNFGFPTAVEKLLWRICSLILTGGPAVMLAMLLCQRVTGLLPPDPVELVIIFVVPALTIVSRLVLLVETFRSLYYLEPAGYATTWAVDIPHIG